MAKKLIVPIVADSAAFKRGLKESSTAAQQFEGKIKGTTSRVRSQIIGMGAAFIGVGGFIEGVKLSVVAAEDLEKSQRGLNAQLKANHESLRAIQPQLSGLGNEMAKLGYTNSQTEQAFTRLDRASGSSAMAFKYMGVTADLAAAKHIDLSQAALVVGKVMTGTTSVLNRYGIAVPKGTSATEALAIAQKKLAGQAEAGATPMARFHATLTNMEATIGQALLPTIGKYLDKVSEWFSKSKNQQQITDAVKAALHGLGVVLGTLKDAFDRIWPSIKKVKDAFGDWKPLIVAAGAALVAIGVLSPWTALAVGAVYVITHWKKVKTWFEAFWVTIRKGFEFLWDALKVDANIAALNVVEPFSHLPGALGGWARKAKKSLEENISGIQADMQSKIDDISSAWKHGGRTAGEQWVYEWDKAMKKLPGKPKTLGPGPGMSPPEQANPPTTSSARVKGTSGYITPGLAAVEAYAGVRVNDDYATSGHAKNSYHYKGEAADLAVSTTAWEKLFKVRKQFAELFGPSGLYHYGAKFSDAKLQAEHMDHIHVAYTGAAGAFKKSTATAASIPAALPGDAAASTKAEAAQTAAEKKKAAAAKAAAREAFNSWKENYFTPLDNEYKTDLQIPNEKKRLAALQGLLKKAKSEELGATKDEKQKLFDEENKIRGKIKSLREKMAADEKAILAKKHAAYVKGLQDDLTAAQTILARQQTLFDRSWSRITSKIVGAFNKATQAGLAAIQGKYGAATPEEQARDAFQAQLDAAQKAADLASAQNDLISAQQSGDPDAVRTAQAHLDDIQNAQKLADLTAAADKSRAIANAAQDKETADYQAARDAQLDNLNDWLDDQKTALENGSETWAQFWQAAFSDAPEKYAPNAVSALQGVIDQLQRINELQNMIDQASGGAGTITLPGGLSPIPAGVIGGGFGGSFASGGIVPGSLGQPTLILAHGGETVIPNGGGGGSNLTVNVYGWVGSDQQIAARLRDELTRIGRRDVNIFAGLA